MLRIWALVRKVYLEDVSAHENVVARARRIDPRDQRIHPELVRLLKALVDDFSAVGEIRREGELRDGEVEEN